MPALIVTFASQTIFAGLAYIICNGTPISRFPDSFLQSDRDMQGLFRFRLSLWLYVLQPAHLFW